MTEPKFVIEREEKVIDTDFMSLVNLYVKLPSGDLVRRPTIRRIEAVAVIPVFNANSDDAQILLERQYRPSIDDRLLEIPAGRMDIEGEEIVAAARRELREETGYEAESIESLFSVDVTPGWADEKMHFFYATGLTFHSVNFDSEEESHMEILRIPVKELPSMISKGEITDSKTIIGALLAHLRWSNR